MQRAVTFQSRVSVLFRDGKQLSGPPGPARAEHGGPVALEDKRRSVSD